MSNRQNPVRTTRRASGEWLLQKGIIFDTAVPRTDDAINKLCMNYISMALAEASGRILLYIHVSSGYHGIRGWKVKMKACQ
jgi:hypothetical protein